MSFSSLRPLVRALPRAAALRASLLQQNARSVRSYATEAAAKGPNVLLYGGIAAAAVAGAGAYYALSGDAAAALTEPKKIDYQAIYNAIADILDAEDYDDGSYGPVLVRLSWHCSGTYDKDTKTGGSNGATMRFAPEATHGANAGLDAARNKLEVIKARFPEISYSDLWTLAGVVGVQEMGGPYVQWRAGRVDAPGAEACTPDGRLPDGDKGNDHIRKIFYRMGFNDDEIVALSGAHAVGRCHSDRSGFDGPWTFSPTTFTNDYFKLLLDDKWALRKWKGPIQYEDVKTKSIMMLTTDHALITDKVFRKMTEVYARDEPKFFKDFAVVFQKLHELGVPLEQLSEPIPLIKVEDQPKK